MVVTGENANYEIVQKLGSTEYLSYYICTTSSAKDRWQILAIAAQIKHNVMIDRTTYLLKRLCEYSELYEQEFAKAPEHSGQRIHYDWLFPQVMDEFTLYEQGERRVAILDFLDVDLHKAFALMQLIDKRKRVDLRTSAWIMGRFLKLLSFLHECDVSAPIIISNFLLEPQNHRLLMVNWTNGVLGENLTPAQRCFAIKQAAESTLLLLDANYGNGRWHYDHKMEDCEAEYIDCLASMHRGDFTDAIDAHIQFYATVEKLWGRAFYPFTTYNKTE